MDFAIILICTGINLMINAFTINFIMKKIENLVDETVKGHMLYTEHLNKIYAIMEFNELKMPKE